MFWKPIKYSICEECKVYFEPASVYEKRWGNLCPLHRKSVMDRDKKRDSVIAWATINWEKLIEMMEKDQNELKNKYNNLTQKHMNDIGSYSNLQQKGFGMFYHQD